MCPTPWHTLSQNPNHQTCSHNPTFIYLLCLDWPSKKKGDPHKLSKSHTLFHHAFSALCKNSKARSESFFHFMLCFYIFCSMAFTQKVYGIKFMPCTNLSTKRTLLELLTILVPSFSSNLHT